MKNYNLMYRVVYGAMLCVYMYIVLYFTLWGRPVYLGDPFGVVFGGWDFRLPEYGGEEHALYNLFMLLPFTFLLLSILPDKERKLSKLMVIAVAVSFVMSSVIEVSQVIFCVGTLQISDLVYNTISGAMGAVVYYVVRILQHYRARYQVQVM